jgi:DNA gyrase subunit A
MVVTLSHMVATSSASRWRSTSAQARGGRGKQAAAVKDDDFVDRLFIANTHDYILCFSSRGRVLLAEGVRSAGRRSATQPWQADHQSISRWKRMKRSPPSCRSRNSTMTITCSWQRCMGTVKKTPLSDFQPTQGRHYRRGPGRGRLPDRRWRLTNGSSDIVLVSDAGKAVWFDEEDVRPMGRGARGVRGMKLQEGQSVISLLVAESDQATVLVATENGYGKRTVLADFRHSGRGTQGVRAIADSERNGTVVGAKLVNDDDEIMLITTGGVLIRTRVSEIRGMGRATQGVTLISLDDGEKLAGLEKVAESVAEIEAEVETAVEADVESEEAAPAPEAEGETDEGGAA